MAYQPPRGNEPRFGQQDYPAEYQTQQGLHSSNQDLHEWNPYDNSHLDPSATQSFRERHATAFIGAGVALLVLAAAIILIGPKKAVNSVADTIPGLGGLSGVLGGEGADGNIEGSILGGSSFGSEATDVGDLSEIPSVTTVKPAPAGLLLRGLMDSAEGGFPSACDKARKGVDGGYCQLVWKDIEPSPGNYNFSIIDQGLKEALAVSKAQGYQGKTNEVPAYRVMLRVRGGVFAPEWLKKDAGTVKWYFRDTDDDYVLPKFWTPEYSAAYTRLMKAMAARYDGNPLLGSIAAGMCMTLHNEIMWNRLGRSEVEKINLKNMFDAGYTRDRDYACLDNMGKIHSQTWMTTPTSFATHFFQGHYSLEKYDQDEADTAAKLFNSWGSYLGTKRAMFANNSWDADEKIPGTIYELIVGMSKKGYPIGFQTKVLNTDAGTKGYPIEEMLKSVPQGAAAGASWIELPMHWDCRDPYSKEGKSNCKDEAYANSILAKLASGRQKLQANSN